MKKVIISTWLFFSFCFHASAFLEKGILEKHRQDSAYLSVLNEKVELEFQLSSLKRGMDTVSKKLQQSRDSAVFFEEKYISMISQCADLQDELSVKKEKESGFFSRSVPFWLMLIGIVFFSFLSGCVVYLRMSWRE